MHASFLISDFFIYILYELFQMHSIFTDVSLCTCLDTIVVAGEDMLNYFICKGMARNLFFFFWAVASLFVNTACWGLN